MDAPRRSADETPDLPPERNPAIAPVPFSPVEDRLKILNETLPARCEICHQSDRFDAARNYCARCQDLGRRHEKIRLITEPNAPRGVVYIIGYLLGLLAVIFIYIPRKFFRSHKRIFNSMRAALWSFFFIRKRVHRDGTTIIRPNRAAFGGVYGSILLATCVYALSDGNIVMIIASIIIGFLMGALIGASKE